MSNTPKIVTVFGTGKQASAVARSLLTDRVSNFHVRAISRHPKSESSKGLAELGVEVVQADGWNQLELTTAFAGSWAAFVNTNSDDPVFLRVGKGEDEDAPTEFDLGRIIIDSLVAADVKHLVHSSFASSLEHTGGKLFIKPQEMKYRAHQYAKATGHFKSICGVYSAWYFEQFLDRPTAEVFGGFPFTPDAHGCYVFRAPRWGDDELPSFVSISNDFGDIVHGILMQPEVWDGEAVPAVSDVMSFDAVCAAFERVTGQKARYEPLDSWEDFGRGIPEMDEHRLLFAFTQMTGGRYYGDVPTEVETASRLKRVAAKAQGIKNYEDAKLTRLEDWFQVCFAQKK